MTKLEKKQKHQKKAFRLAEKLKKKVARLRVKHEWKTLPKAIRPRQFSSDHIHRFNLHEEIANSLSHAVGALLGFAALVLLIVMASLHSTAIDIVAGSIFGVSIIIAYISSMVYHWVLYPPVKQVFKILDHSSIFILISGSYTPFALVTLHGPVGWTLFGSVWAITVVGIAMKICFIDRFTTFSTILYLAMGWVAVFLSVQLFQHLAFGGVMWLIIGGLCYTIGIIFFILERIPFFHTIWHLFVLAGTISHFFAILFYVMPVTVS
jgi:hemolysin III